MIKRRLLPLLLVVCLTLTMLGCNDYKQIDPTDEENTVVGHVNGKEVYLDELRFVCYTYYDMMTKRYGDGIFEGEDKEYYLSILKDLVYKNITYGYAVIELCEEVGISLGELEITEKVNEILSELTENELGGFSEYKKYLRENHLSDRFLRLSTELTLLENELMYVYIDDLSLIENDDEEVYEIIMREFIKVRHVFIPYSEENAHEKINSALQELKSDSGADMTSLMEKYDMDENMTTNGILILDGYMTDEYQDAAFALEVGDISDIVTDYNGYYIIERLNVSPTDIMLDFDNLKKTYQTYTFYSMIDERQALLSFIPTDAGTSYMSDPFKD